MKSILYSFKTIIGLGQGPERTNRTKRNIFFGFVVKGLNICIGLFLVPITIDYLNPTNYGIWVTLTSLVAWFSFFDVGFGHGLRNRFAEAIAKGEHELAKTYVSTTYAIVFIIITVFLIVFYFLNLYIDWSVILNSGNNILLTRELGNLAIVIFTSFGITFVLNLIVVILNANQQVALSSTIDLVGKVLSLLAIYILTLTAESSLFTLGLVYSSISPLVLLISSIFFFNGRYRLYRPSIKTVDFSKANDLFFIGAKFFLIQIAGILLYQTNNMIITHLFGPAMVTAYNVSFKYFSVLMMGWMIVIGPFWSAITEAWVNRDLNWIKNSMKKLILSWVIVLVIGFVMLMFSDRVFKFWINENFTVPFRVSMLTLGWVLINTWNGIFSQFLNGVGKIKLQMVIGIIVAIINVPLAIVLGKILGIEGVLLANVLLSLVTVIIYPIQYSRLITLRAKGIYNK